LCLLCLRCVCVGVCACMCVVCVCLCVRALVCQANGSKQQFAKIIINVDAAFFIDFSWVN
jgi:hypothetical protein